MPSRSTTPTSPFFSSSTDSNGLSTPSMEAEYTDEFTTAEGAIYDTDYARRCKELMALHASLTTLGAGNLIDLPKIVVIGGQSAGKSSLVEAVSGIAVPRDSGTCTRCPMECTMSPSPDDKWYCDISLRFDHTDSGTRLGSSKTEVFCPRLTEKKNVDIWLRRAQMAILSPHKPHQDFARMSQDDLRYLYGSDSLVKKFSRNTICVDIKDPEATNLSFLDLPGLIQNESQTSIQIVKSLVEDSIGGANSDNTLILVTIPMTDDMENQQAVLLARNADPEGLRTIGVLTKPDMLPVGATNARRKWKDILEGNSAQHALKLGYYCVRLSDDDERARNISRSEAEALSTRYFENTPPWCQFADDERFGIPNFVNNISALLVEMIEKNLPKLKDDVDKQLVKCCSELLALPLPVTNDPSTEILLRVTKFCSALTAAVAGDKSKEFAQSNRALYQTFKSAIRASAPDFRPFNDHAQYLRPCFPSDDKESDVASLQPWDLAYVGEVIRKSIAWELPDHVPFEATKTLVLQFTKLWKEPAMACFDSVFSNLKKLVDEHVEVYFKTYRQLRSHVNNLVVQQIEQCKLEALSMLTKLLAFESTPVFTQNTHYLEQKAKVWLQRYSDVYRDSAHYAVQAGQTSIAVRARPSNSHLHSAGYREITLEAIASVLLPHDQREELIVMSKVRAFFHVAYKRIIDYIPLAIEHELNQALVDRLPEGLFSDLTTESTERLEELLSEDPTVASKRKFLQGRVATLTEMQARLAGFRRKSVM